MAVVQDTVKEKHDPGPKSIEERKVEALEEIAKELRNIRQFLPDLIS